MSPASPKTLDKALQKVPADAKSLEVALPAAHVAPARFFGAITNSGSLAPQHCPVFDRKLLYFFYGGVLYRGGRRPTLDTLDLPVAFLFGPEILNEVRSYFPFDTGAHAKGMYGKPGESLKPLETRFRVLGRKTYLTACKLITVVFGSNANYLAGKPDPACATRPEPFPVLHAFLSSNLTKHNVDHRFASVECQFTSPIPLDKNLLWVGFPKVYTGLFAEICGALEPYVPEHYAYDCHRVMVPAEAAAILQDRASAVVDRYAKRPR